MKSGKVVIKTDPLYLKTLFFFKLRNIFPKITEFGFTQALRNNFGIIFTCAIFSILCIFRSNNYRRKFFILKGGPDSGQFLFISSDDISIEMTHCDRSHITPLFPLPSCYSQPDIQTNTLGRQNKHESIPMLFCF